MRKGRAERLFWVLAQPRMTALLDAAAIPDRSTRDLAKAVGISANLAATLLSHLRRQGLLERQARKGSTGNNAMWRLSILGTDVLQAADSIRNALADADQR